MENKTSSEYVSIKVRRDVAQSMKVVATLNAQTIQQWLEWTVGMAYNSAKLNNRKHIKK